MHFTEGNKENKAAKVILHQISKRHVFAFGDGDLTTLRYLGCLL
jgi:hypothetical protein